MGIGAVDGGKRPPGREQGHMIMLNIRYHSSTFSIGLPNENSWCPDDTKFQELSICSQETISINGYVLMILNRKKKRVDL